MKNENNYLDNVFEALAKIDKVAYVINDDANAFGRTGNHVMQDLLYGRADELMAASEAIRKAVAKEINDEFKESTKAARDVVLALLPEAG